MCLRGLLTLMIGSATLLGGVAGGAPPPRPEPPGDGPAAGPAGHLRRFMQQHPRAGVSVRGDRIRRVYGPGLSSGDTVAESMQRFCLEHAGMLGVDPDQLIGLAPTSLGYDVATGRSRLTARRYHHVVDGVPVFRSELVLLVRNEPGHPLVLVSADVRDASGVRVPPAGPPPPDAMLVNAIARATVGRDAVVLDTAPVIWAGTEARVEPARLAHRSTVQGPRDPWLLVTDALDGSLLHLERMACFFDVTGRVDGLATEGVGAEHCEEETPHALPYVPISVGGTTVYADAEGGFAFTTPGERPVPVTVTLGGLYFPIVDFTGNDLELNALATAATSLELLLNERNGELGRAQVNAYVAANEARDYVLAHSPSYPGLGAAVPIYVNRDDSHCPGNAWYDFVANTMSFCQAGEKHPNTAWSSVVYHEYGHHLVQMGGSGQGAYGEGIGDAISLLLLDEPELAVGFFGDCDAALRTADNDCQYHPVGCSTCGVSVHSCAQLLSGCVWSLRNELLEVDAETYRATLARLVLDSIPLHTGASIEADITVDFLTVDDDNDDIFDGTPHYHQIADAFGAHGLPAPFVPLISFSFPEGLPEMLTPNGTVVRTMRVNELSGTALPDTGTMHVSSTGLLGTFYPIALEPIGENLYEVEFPAVGCWSALYYYFSAEAALGLAESLHTYPVDAPRHTLNAIAADAAQPGGFVDDFERDLGWTVWNSETLEDGAWERTTPTGSGVRGDPPSDADGSGQCFLTEDDPEDVNSDVDDGATILTSPLLDASEADGDAAFVSYSRWFSNTVGGNPNQDVFVVEVSDDGGATWAVLEVVGPTGPEVDGGWIFRRFRVADYVEPNDAFRIRFTASDTDPQSIVEAAVDAVAIRRYVCDEDGLACLADVDGNGLVDVGDLISVLLAWGAEGGPADVNGDGSVNAVDLLLVAIAWGPC